MLSSAQRACLLDILGEAGLVQDPDDDSVYNLGARGDVGTASFVARPATVEQVSRVLAYCWSERIHLVPQSANTGLVMGSVADDSGAQGVLSLDRIARRFEVDADNRSLRVDAGFRLSEINARLADFDLFFPIDLGADPRIGGMLATNTGGARFLRYGDVRKNVLGLSVVLADAGGTVLDLSRGLRKNNVGVDWKHLFVGTCGAFGVIVDCTLNLERRPKQAATAMIHARGLESIGAIRSTIEEMAGNYLSAFEVMSGAAIRATLDHAPALRNPFPREMPDYAVLVELTRSWNPREGEQALSQVLEGILERAWDGEGAPVLDAVVGAPESMWALRHAIPEGLRKAGHLVAFDLAFLRGVVAEFLLYMRRELPGRFPDIEICDFGHFGDGGVHFNLVIARGDTRLADPEFHESLRDWITRTAVEDFGGSFSGEHGIGRKNQRDYDRYTTAQERYLARMLKQATSPGLLGGLRLG